MHVATTRGHAERSAAGVPGARAGALGAGLRARPGGGPAQSEGGAGRRPRRHYLLRLTGRLSLVWVCFFLLQPVRLYW